MLRFRKGLGQLTSCERAAVLCVEGYLISQAVQQEYYERLITSRTLVLDLDDVEPIRTALRWARKQGRIYLQAKVFLAGSSEPRTFHVRFYPRTLANRVAKIGHLAY